MNSCLCMSLYAPTRQGVGNTLSMKNTGLPVMHPMILCFLIVCLTFSFCTMAPKQIYGYVQHMHSMVPNMVLWGLCENIQLDSWPTVLSIHIAYLRRSILIFSHHLLGLASVWFVRGFLTKILYMFGISLILTICTAHCNVQDLTTLITEVLSWQSSLHCLIKKGLLWNVEFAVLWLTSVISSQSVFHVSLNALDTFSATVMWCSCNPF